MFSARNPYIPTNSLSIQPHLANNRYQGSKLQCYEHFQAVLACANCIKKIWQYLHITSKKRSLTIVFKLIPTCAAYKPVHFLSYIIAVVTVILSMQARPSGKCYLLFKVDSHFISELWPTACMILKEKTRHRGIIRSGTFDIFQHISILT